MKNSKASDESVVAPNTITYTYDDLHRLATAVATNAANGQNFNHTYTYDAIGNIITMTGLTGDYQYQGTGKANPHAATVVNGQTYAYDNNGNLLSDSTWTHSWEYDNRLKQSVNGGTTVSYAYDHSGQRVKLVNGSSTTRYANKLYNSDGTKNVKHIYAGNQLVATLENSTLQYIHTDHLTGSNVATNNSGTMAQLLDYYPYGSMRIDQTTTFDEARKFTGHEFDRSTSLTYANARYYKQDIGRFLSQDPAFINTNFRLGDPQSLNSYGYSRNNPLKYVDPNGEDFMPFQSLFNFARNNPNSSVNNELRGIANFASSLANVAKTALDFTPAGDISVLATGQTLTGDKAGVLDYGFAGLGVITLGASTEVKAGVKAVDKIGDVTKLTNLPQQIHHVATNKSSQFTPQMQEIASRFGLSLDQLWNKVQIPHLGRHATEYHQYVLDKMQDFAKNAGDSSQKFLNQFDSLRSEVKNSPEMLKKDFWKKD